MYFPILLFVYAVSAAVLSPLQVLNNELTSPFYASNDGTHLTGLPNTTTSSLKSSMGSDLRVDCNAPFGGTDLRLPSCVQALRSLDPTPEVHLWEARDARQHLHEVFALPFRWISGK